MTRPIIGSKGGSGGSDFVTKPDTLRSDDSFEVLMGLGSGRWKGLVEGLKSLKINGVPLENSDGTSNFEDVAVIFADGNPLVDQLVNFKLGGGGAVQNVSTTLANTNVNSPGPWVSGAVNTQNADFIDLRFIVQQLFFQDEKSIRENTANIEIQMRPTNSADWINIFTGTQSNTVQYNQDGYDYLDGVIGNSVRLYLSRSMFKQSGTGFRATSNPNLQITGKGSSASVKEIRVAVPKEGKYANVGWEVRARLLEKDTVDNDTTQERRTITFESITAVLKTPLGDDPEWDGQVWMQVIGKASDQFNGFPEIEGVFDTKICKTPPTNIWDPETRVYSNNTWDGSYEEHYTNDPSWNIKEFIEDPIHGVAGLQPGATLDKWDALEASKYYSEPVSDGRGGTHPRFSMNMTINEARDVTEMLQFLAGSVNSYIEEVNSGTWRLKVDKPESPLMLFTEDNIFGEFNYSHSDVDTRFNEWRGTFLNEDFDYEQDTVRIFDQPDIDRNGLKFTEIALIGCTNRQEALRRLMFRMRVSLNEYKVVSFTTNRIARYFSPLNTILVADGSLNADHLTKSTSRLESHSGTTVKLKRPVRLEVGVTYLITFTTKDKRVLTRTITNSDSNRGDVSEIQIDSALSSEAMQDSAVALTALGLPSNPLTYRILSVEKSNESEDEYAITASLVDSGKWAAMDNVSEQEILGQESGISVGSPTVPSQGMFNLLEYNTEFETKRVLQVNWNRPSGFYLEGFKVEFRLNDGPWLIANPNLKDSFFELQNPEDGTYDFKITAIDRRGIISNPLIGRYSLDGAILPQGPPGESVKLAYADSADGTVNFSLSPGDRAYLGQYTSADNSQSTDPADYSWSKIKGEDGVPAIPFFAYADSLDGQTNFSFSPGTRAYLGKYVSTNPIQSTDPNEYTWIKVKGDTGTGAAAITPYLTKPSIVLFSYANGNVANYGPASGQFVLYQESNNISGSFGLTIIDNPQNLSINISGNTYAVIGGFDSNEDTASFVLRATGTGSYSGRTFDKAVTLSKSKGGYEIFSNLPTIGNFEGRTVFNDTDGKLYRYHNGAFTAAVPVGDLSGRIVADQIEAGAVTAAKLNVSQLSAISANLGVVTAGKIQNAAGTAKVDMDNSQIYFNNGAYMKVTGVGFGSTNQFIEWWGPSFSDLNDCTEANAIYYLKSNGDSYFGGSLSAGVLQNSAQTTSIVNNAAVSIGPFGTNGNPIIVVNSYSLVSRLVNTFSADATGRSNWDSAVTAWGATPPAGTEGDVNETKTGTCNVSIRLDRNGSQWGTLNVSSYSETLTGFKTAEAGVQPELTYTRTVSGSITKTDNAGGLTDRTFTATLTTRTDAVVGSVISQRISLVATED